MVSWPFTVVSTTAPLVELFTGECVQLVGSLELLPNRGIIVVKISRALDHSLKILSGARAQRLAATPCHGRAVNN